MTDRWSAARLQAVAPVALIWAALILAAGYALFGLQLSKTRGAWPDFTWYYIGARLVASGQGQHLYDFALQQRLESQLTGIPAGHLLFLPFLNPPLLAVLLAPLAQLPFAQAYFVFVGLNVAAAAAAMWLLSGEAGLSGRGRLAASAVALTSFPAFVTFARGQVDGLVLLGAAVFVVAWRRRRATAATALALSFFKFNVVLGLPIYAVARRSLAGLAGLVTAVAITAVPPALLLGPHIWVDYAHAISPVASGGLHQALPRVGTADYGVFGLAGTFGLPRAAGFAAAGVLLVGFGLAMALRGGESRLDIALGAVISLLASPYQGIQDLLLLTVPLLLLAGAVARRRLPASGWVAVLALYLAGFLPFFAPLAVPILMLLAAGYLAWAIRGQPLQQ